jgi:hypothetical protein
MSTRRALANLVLVFLEGRNYNSMNPYLRPEVKQALKALGGDHHNAESVRAIAAGRKAKHRYGGG